MASPLHDDLWGDTLGYGVAYEAAAACMGADELVFGGYLLNALLATIEDLVDLLIKTSEFTETL